MYNINEDEIRNKFLDFMRSVGIGWLDNRDVIIDGQIHRFKVQGDKHGQRSGAYCIYSDEWPAGWVQDWRMGAPINWSFPRELLDDEGRKHFSDEKAMQDAIKRSRERAKKRQAELEQIQLEASGMANTRWAAFPPAPDDHPYLKVKHVRNFGLRWQSDINSLIVPLRDIDGRFWSYQCISPNGEKKFYTDAPTKGRFFSIALDILKGSQDDTILVGEGYATIATVYDLTSIPCVAAMNCHNLRPVCEALKSKYPNARIVIIADNDANTQGNPGLTKANEACEALKLQGVVYPEFDNQHHGSDWNDYAQVYGEERAQEVLQEKIKYECLSEARKKLLSQVDTINGNDLLNMVFPPIKWAVEGFLPSGCTILAGAPKVGKSILALHLAVGVAIGGCVLGKINVLQGDVLYLALEDNKRRIQERLNSSSFFDDYKPDLSHLDIVTAIPRQHEGGLEYIQWWLEEHPEVRLVIIDTLQKFRKLLSGKGSMYAEDYEAISQIKALADKFDVPILIIHHLKKQREESDWLNEFSGSQGISGAADTLFSLKRARTENTGTLHRTGRDVEEKDFTLRLDNFGWVLQSEAEKFTMPEWKRQILDYLREHGEITPMELSELTNSPLDTAKKQLQRLLKDGIIKRLTRGKYTL